MPASGSELVEGAVVGNDRVVRFIGQGGMGRVYEARHLKLGRRFALKVLKARYRLDVAVRHRLRREARVGATLDSS